MNLSKNHPQDKPVSAFSLFQGQGNATSIQILQNEQLKEHLTKIPAMLICVSGEVVFEIENGIKETLMSGDYLAIEPLVKHWVNAITDSQLILLK